MILRHLALFLLTAPLVAGAMALGLILSQGPEVDPVGSGAGAVTTDTTGAFAARALFTARDGATLGYLSWGVPEAERVIVALHGSGGHGGWMAGIGAALAETTGAQVVAPDLRGHGPAPIRRGDVDHIGQLEDDLADLIAHLGWAGREVVLLGHSGGGGLAIRFAGGAHRSLIDRAVLVAPFLQHDAPSALPMAGDGWAHVLTRRIAGLYMLNAVGITALNHLTVVQFRYPPDLLTGPAAPFATRNYSYRMQFALAPRRDWQADVAALPPVLLVAGSADRTFRADAYEPSMAPLVPEGRFAVLAGAGHTDILGDPRLIDAVAAFLLD
ncbi:alpha/beta hydrolase [Natronohydrobacter thiooxidans]|uniref:alpha/beta hydrolase n=1 Tax=Natronohydrobacter thiooxidans TaxID=87172 RepID=UPI0008FF40ED|nr:alpha/beta fold hydrolase [Natronohydrobacter thiooxidans]